MAQSNQLKPMNIEPIEKATNRGWSEWMAFMESIGARDLNHTEIAQHVVKELEGMKPVVENPGWWAQGITVAYEQQSGRRLPGQQADGTFQMSVSKTVDLGMREAMEKWQDFAASDREVTKLLGSEPRTSGTEKRLTWRGKATDGSALMFTSEPRPNGKTAVIAQQMKLPTQERNEAAKEFWAEVMERFVATL